MTAHLGLTPLLTKTVQQGDELLRKTCFAFIFKGGPEPLDLGVKQDDGNVSGFKAPVRLQQRPRCFPADLLRRCTSKPFLQRNGVHHMLGVKKVQNEGWLLFVSRLSLVCFSFPFLPQRVVSNH